MPETDDMLQVPRRYRITLMGDAQSVYFHPASRSGLAFLIDKLLSGQAVSRRGLRRWGISVEIEDDTDGGPENLDNLIQPADFSR